MSKIRVLVADDSLTVRKQLAAAIAADPDCEVVGEAADGRSTIDLCRRLRPSVITLDMLMPGVDGLSATEQIMAFCPTPILVVSGAIRREAQGAFAALAAGAVEVLEKPAADEPIEQFSRRFVAAVKLVSRIKVITHVRGRLHACAPQRERGFSEDADVTTRAGSSSTDYQLIAVGASTGGPRALCAILGALPPGFPLPILVVLHISPAFGVSFVEWMRTQVALPISLAVDGAPLPLPGAPRVVVAPPELHLVVRNGRLRLTTDPERYSCRPSVDVLFESVAGELGPSAIGCLLTGMGRDGAEGLLAMRQSGGMTIAQDQATSVVFGMPKAAAAIDAARLVLPLGTIGVTLGELASRGKSSPAG